MTRDSTRLAAALAFTGSLLVVCAPDPVEAAVQAPNASPACATTADLLPARRWEGAVDSQSVCLRLSLERGQFARVAVEGARGMAVFLQATVLGPGDSVPFLRSPRVLSWEARTPGVHTIVLTTGRATRVTATVTDIEDAGALAARRRALAADPRVAWLAARAIPFRTLDPRDTAFADLQRLRPLLSNVRVVLLGEADHGDGSDFLAKSRLIRFLHTQMGFDVLAFEAGVYDMWRASREIGAGRDPRASFLQGLYWLWGLSEQLGPLMAYVAETAHSPRPLVLAGIDVQRSASMWAGAAVSDTLLAELATFLNANGLGGPLADPRSAESQLLKRLHDYQYRPAPDSTAMAALQSAVNATAGRIERAVATDEGRIWTRVLWNVAARAALAWPRWPGARRSFCETDACRTCSDRDPEMAQNLVWLANQMYPGRKIIVWAHNGHIIRDRSRTESDSSGGSLYAMGDGVRAAFGNDAYAIASVSYEGSYHWAHPQRPTFEIVPDQSPEPEFEELMVAAGHRIGLLDLRQAVPGSAWLAQPFLARPIEHSTDRSPWGRSFDAFLFIRTQEPSLAIPLPQP